MTVVCSRMGVSYAAYLFGITFVPWYKMYVWPHYCLASTQTDVHANIESLDLATLDFVITEVVRKAI